MAPDSLLCFHFLCYFLLLLVLSSADRQKSYEEEDCPKSFVCGNLGELHFPFTDTSRPECGLPITGCDNPWAPKEVQLRNKIRCEIKDINSVAFNSISIIVQDHEFQELWDSKNCSAFNYNFTIPPMPPTMCFSFLDKTTLFKCDHAPKIEGLDHFLQSNCGDYDIYLDPLGQEDEIPSSPKACSTISLPFKRAPPTNVTPQGHSDLFTLLIAEAHIQGKLCDGHKRKPSKAIIIGLCIGSTVVIIMVLIIFILLYKRRGKSAGFQSQSRNIYSDAYSNTNPESGIIYFGVPVFSYEELEQSTNNFDPSRELGKGGFGTVYYGKLKDGREVAVKHLFERSFRRVEQFKNEIQILTCLRHRNLVSLYGCTSRHCHELLLVYEYIPNGTVGCHLHGKLAKPGSLPWPVRMRIAVETASALSYLHACDIIHRDVKTSNLLLDNNFCAKVADFGLSRFFPNFLSHVSTAPQGTPGYLDPEYHQCYQLTNKSDVYSFGVVLIELISSMPAIDITRNKDEIKLANLATKIIQRRAFTELVDPSLGFELDNEVKRMIVSVSELAFQCLQRDKDQRPTMDEVVEVLQNIESGKDDLEHLEFHAAGISERKIHTYLPTSLDRDGAGSLMNLKPQRLLQTL